MTSLSGLSFLKAKFPKIKLLIEAEHHKKIPNHLKLSTAVNQAAQSNIFAEYQDRKAYLHNFDYPEKEAVQF